ncbi:hypothetical protein Pelo_10820 [Pelomyxa schiedti]|nr:hypothetical protein Pelo_10820 [Pelomyxa schiedti]
MESKLVVSVEADNVVVITTMEDLSNKKKAEEEAERWGSSLVSHELWNQCETKFQSMMANSKDPESKTVRRQDVRKQWAEDHPTFSPFEIASAETKAGMIGNKVSMLQFAMGSLLLSNQCPTFCTARQYMESGFEGSSKMMACCQGRSEFRLFITCLFLNLFLAVGSVSYSISGILSFGTLVIGILIFWEYKSAPFLWKNELLSGAILIFACLGLVCALIGVLYGYFLDIEDVFWWYRLWPISATFQMIYLGLSSFFLIHCCVLLYSFSPSIQIPIPQVTLVTFTIATAWSLLVLNSIAWVASIILAIALPDWHILPIAIVFLCGAMFIVTSLSLFAVAYQTGYPKTMSMIGIVTATTTLIGAIGFIVVLFFTGHVIRPDPCN